MLNAAALATAMAAQLNTRMLSIYPQSAAGLAEYHGLIAEAFAAAIVTYFQTYAEVLPNGSPSLNVAGITVAGKGTVF